MTLVMATMSPMPTWLSMLTSPLRMAAATSTRRRVAEPLSVTGAMSVCVKLVTVTWSAVVASPRPAKVSSMTSAALAVVTVVSTVTSSVMAARTRRVVVVLIRITYL